MPNPLRVLIADDELVARQRLRRLLTGLGDVEVVGECKSGQEVLTRVKASGSSAIDLILLDIHMPGLSGLEALRALPAPAPYVVFCTAHAEHAVTAFDAGALDYLLKPVTGPRLEKALGRARSRDQQARFQELLAKIRLEPAAPERLAVPGRNGIQLLDPLAVSHAMLEGELVTLVSDQGKVFTDLPLNDLEARLPKDRFVRVHRRALVNLHQVARLEPAETGGFYALMQSGDRVEVSRQAARELKRRLGIARASPEAATESEE